MKPLTILMGEMVGAAKHASRLHIVLGTKAVARDLQHKLRLLGYTVSSYLYGGADDESSFVQHFERLREIENPKNCIFHVFYNSDEWEFIAPSLAVMCEIAGVISDYNMYYIGLVISDIGDGYGTTLDMFGNLLHSIDNSFLVTHGNKADAKPNIQLWGGSGQSDIFPFSKHYMGESLHTELNKLGIIASVDVHAQWTRSVADNILRFLQGGLISKPDVVVVYYANKDFMESDYVEKSVLAARTKLSNWWHIIRWNVESIVGDASQGIAFDSDLLDIAVYQHRVFTVLSELYGFRYYAVIHPSLLVLPENKNKGITERSARYAAKHRQMKDEFVSKASEYGKVIDLSGAFNEYENIFPFYMDSSHLTDEGNAIAARRLAEELKKDFSGVYEI